MSGGPLQVVAQVAPGVQLVVIEVGGSYCASLRTGEWPDGVTLCVNTDVYRSNSRVCTGIPRARDIRIWLGRTAYRLPWLELLKVADFMRLDIPLPHPLVQPMQQPPDDPIPLADVIHRRRWLDLFKLMLITDAAAIVAVAVIKGVL